MNTIIITHQTYGEAVRRLLPFAAYNHNGSARAAAQVLLSSYNGDNFQLDVSDLTHLDRKNYRAAITVIRSRYELSTEPHIVIENGAQLFIYLSLRWKRIARNNRYKRCCESCQGSGKIWDNGIMGDPENCPECQGVGVYG